MTTPSHLRRTTSDPRHDKVLRVKGALLTPNLADLPNRELARRLGVDESMIRKYRPWAAQFLSPAAKSDAGKKRRKGP
jgi:hypothetical protein